MDKYQVHSVASRLASPEMLDPGKVLRTPSAPKTVSTCNPSLPGLMALAISSSPESDAIITPPPLQASPHMAIAGGSGLRAYRILSNTKPKALRSGAMALALVGIDSSTYSTARTYDSGQEKTGPSTVQEPLATEPEATAALLSLRERQLAIPAKRTLERRAVDIGAESEFPVPEAKRVCRKKIKARDADSKREVPTSLPSKSNLGSALIPEIEERVPTLSSPKSNLEPKHIPVKPRSTRTPLPNFRTATSEVTRGAINPFQRVSSRTYIGGGSWTSINQVPQCQSAQLINRQLPEDDLLIKINSNIPAPHIAVATPQSAATAKHQKRRKRTHAASIFQSEPTSAPASLSAPRPSSLQALAIAALSACPSRSTPPTSSRLDNISKSNNGFDTSINDDPTKYPNAGINTGPATMANISSTTAAVSSSKKRPKWLGLRYEDLILGLFNRLPHNTILTVNDFTKEIEAYRLREGFPYPPLGQSIRAACFRGKDPNRPGGNLWEHVCVEGKRTGGYRLMDAFFQPESSVEAQGQDKGEGEAE